MLQSRLEEYTRMTAKLRADVEAGQKDLREELLDAREAHRSALATVEELQGVVKKLEAKIAAKDEKYRSVKHPYKEAGT